MVQQGTARPVLSEDLRPAATRTLRKPVTLDAGALKLQEGPAELEVEARDTLWRPRPPRGPRLVHRFTVDLTPPKLELKTATGYIKHAGAGIVVYRPEGAARSGIRVGDGVLSGRRPGWPRTRPSTSRCSWCPYNGPAVPPVGHRGRRGRQRARDRRPGDVPARAVPEGHDQADRGVPAPEDAGARAADAGHGHASRSSSSRSSASTARAGRVSRRRTARSARGETSPKPLWTGPFRQQSNTKVFANFPEERTYLLDGRTVDTQWHLGIDLASNRQSPVEASNAGRVVFTGPNGIYGNMVVLDHGLGLMSLYAHLSDIAVKVGQTVQKGEALGRSGETGLAGGDHLHFALLVHGMYTSPIEWWDDHWLKDRIAKPLVDAGIALPGITDGVTRRPRASGPVAPPARRSAGPARPPLSGPARRASPGPRGAPLEDDGGDRAAHGQQEKEGRGYARPARQRPSGRPEAQPAPDRAEPHQAERQRHVGQPQWIHGRQCGPTPCGRARGPGPGPGRVPGAPSVRGFPGFSPTL